MTLTNEREVILVFVFSVGYSPDVHVGEGIAQPGVARIGPGHFE